MELSNKDGLGKYVLMAFALVSLALRDENHPQARLPLARFPIHATITLGTCTILSFLGGGLA